MATHPSEHGCLCEWGGDDHYPKLIKYSPVCPLHNEDYFRRLEIERQKIKNWRWRKGYDD